VESPRRHRIEPAKDIKGRYWCHTCDGLFYSLTAHRLFVHDKEMPSRRRVLLARINYVLLVADGILFLILLIGLMVWKLIHGLN
jgi:hypothetical protein